MLSLAKSTSVDNQRALVCLEKRERYRHCRGTQLHSAMAILITMVHSNGDAASRTESARHWGSTHQISSRSFGTAETVRPRKVELLYGLYAVLYALIIW
jgi:hypothetical protein